ncbi:hypothetical protein MferCBS31731_001044 [Microsporum ferrugineum]
MTLMLADSDGISLSLLQSTVVLNIMRRSNRILRRHDDDDVEGPSAQLSFDLKTIAKRSAAKRIGSALVKQAETLGETPTQKSTHTTVGISLNSISPADSDIGTLRGKLKRPRRNQERRLKSSSEDIYDVDEAPLNAVETRGRASAHSGFTPDTESSDGEPSSSYVECEDVIGLQHPPDIPPEGPLVMIEKAPVAEFKEMVTGRDGVATSDGSGKQDEVLDNGRADSPSNLTEPKGNPMLESEYGPTSTDSDEDKDEDVDEDENGREDVLETLEQEEMVLPKDTSEDDIYLDISDTEVYTEYGLRDDSTFWDASKIFDQEQNWRELISEAKRLIKQTNGLTIESTKDLFRSISNGIDTYKESIDSKNKNQSFNFLDAEHSSTASIERQVSQVLIDLYPYNVDLPKNLSKLTSTTYEVATDTIPGMVGLLQWCLVAHYSNDSVTAEGIDQLTRLLDSLGKLCEAVQAEPPRPTPELADKLKITSVLVRFMSYVFRHQQLNTRKPATTQPLIGRSQNLGQHHDEHEVGLIESEASITALQEKCPWSRAESEALFDALQKYRGPERYNLILRELRDVLGHRSVEELREKTMETRAGLLALPDEKRPHYSQWSFLDQ